MEAQTIAHKFVIACSWQGAKKGQSIKSNNPLTPGEKIIKNIDEDECLYVKTASGQIAIDLQLSPINFMS